MAGHRVHSIINRLFGILYFLRIKNKNFNSVRSISIIIYWLHFAHRLYILQIHTTLKDNEWRRSYQLISHFEWCCRKSDFDWSYLASLRKRHMQRILMMCWPIQRQEYYFVFVPFLVSSPVNITTNYIMLIFASN